MWGLHTANGTGRDGRLVIGRVVVTTLRAGEEVPAVGPSHILLNRVRSMRVSSTEQAVTLLGVETLRLLVLSQALFSRFDAKRFPDFSLDSLWRHSLGTARCAQALAGVEGADKTDKDVCFMAMRLTWRRSQSRDTSAVTTPSRRRSGPSPRKNGTLQVVMLGIKAAQMALWAGADDFDGTIIEERIGHAAGADSPKGLTLGALRRAIEAAGLVPVERTADFRPVTLA